MGLNAYLAEINKNLTTQNLPSPTDLDYLRERRWFIRLVALASNPRQANIATEAFFVQRAPPKLERALADPHYKMALIFRWYLGLSSRWAVTAEPGCEMDYQIWCGPSLGAFNDWSRGTYLEQPENRHVADVALQILTGAAYLVRVRLLELYGVELLAEQCSYRPEKPIA